MNKNISPILHTRGAQMGMALLLASAHGICAAQGMGGLDQANKTAEEVKTYAYAFVGMVALLYMLFLGVMAFTEKKSWSDFGWGVVHVAAVGGSIALGTWAWNLFA